MSFFGGLMSTIFERRNARHAGDDKDARSVFALCEALLSSRAEVSGATLAHTILNRFERMDTDEKRAFFLYLTHDLEIVPSDVTATLSAYKNKPSKQTYQAFTAACEPKRQELFRRLNQVQGATARLVEMRGDLLKLMDKNPDLEPLDVDLRRLFASWFNRGFLVLRPINWDSPADILEKIIAYEAVHAIDSWAELRRRLKPADRRCFAFFHPAMPHEPLIFVQVALMRGFPNSIQTLLADDRTSIEAEEADTAVFYSISNCQSGLSNISFGNSLIKQVASDLARDLPNLSCFTTLSPIPNMNRWLKIADASGAYQRSNQALAAHYLLAAKRSDGMPYDPVARFHLGNGAMIHAVHSDADISENGMRQSNGAMVNYIYDLSNIAQNHEQFVEEKIVVASKKVQSLSASVKAKPTKEGG